MHRVLVCGSTAIDLVGFYPGSFSEYGENNDVSSLNLSLQLSTLQSSFGGCAMNISYGLHKLGIEAIPLSVVGGDFRERYMPYLQRLGININNVVIDDTFEQGATGIITSDRNGNQITLFYPGAATSALRKKPSGIEGINQCELAILAPEGAPIMLDLARDLSRLEIPIIFDPGQCLAEFTQEEVLELLDLSRYTILNGHELDILLRLGGLNRQSLEQKMALLIVTRGADGVEVSVHGQCHHIPAVAQSEILDPTGCGDAFRAGFIYGLLNQLGPIKSAQLGNLMAAENLRSPHTQNYDIDAAKLRKKCTEYFGAS